MPDGEITRISPEGTTYETKDQALFGNVYRLRDVKRCHEANELRSGDVLASAAAVHERGKAGAVGNDRSDIRTIRVIVMKTPCDG